MEQRKSGWMYILNLVVSITILYKTEATNIEDFKKGARFRLARTEAAPLGFEKQRDNQKPDKCELIEACSSGKELQIQEAIGGAMVTPKDVKFLFYSPGSTTYCVGDSEWVMSGEFIGCLMTVFDGKIGHVDTSELVESMCKDMMAEKEGKYFSPYDPNTKKDYEILEELKINNDVNQVYAFGLVNVNRDEFYTLFAKVVDETAEFWEWEIMRNPLKKPARDMKNINS